MSVTAQLADGRTLEFPDGTDPSVVQMTVKKMLAGGPSAAERVASDPITRGAQEAQRYSPAELLAGSAPGRFLLQPARGLLELGSQYIPGANKPIDIGNLHIPGAAEAVQATDDLIKRGREAYQNTGPDIAGIAGEVASPAVLKAGKIAAGMKGLFAKMVGSGATGAVAGAVSPTADKGNFPLEKAEQVGTGAAGGVLLPPAGALLKGLGGTIYKAFEPIIPGGPEAILNRFQTSLLGPAKEKVAQALMAARELVPGSRPTAGEAVAGIPEASAIAAHQQAVSKAPVVSGQFVARAGEQEAARAAALEGIAKPPGTDLGVAEMGRANVAKFNYGRAFDETVKANPELVKLAQDPYFKAALPDAIDLAASKGVSAAPFTKNSLSWEYDLGAVPGEMEHLLMSGDKIVAGISKVKGPGGMRYVAHMADETPNPSQGSGPMIGVDKNLKALQEKVAAFFAPKDQLTQFLHYVKVGLDKQLSRTGDTALAATEKEAVQGVKSKLTAWMDEKNPAYATARARFADMSRPINQMEVGQGLQEKLAAPLGTTERAAAYRAAVRDPAALIKSEVGGPARKLEDIMTPEQLQAINAVGTDLGRKAQFERLARGTNLGGVGMQPDNLLPNLLSRPAMVANWVAKKLGHNLEDRVTAIAGRQYLNPAEFAASLADKPLSVRKRMVDELLARTGYPIVSGAPAAAVAKQY